jgi:hypothetical protein
MVDKPRETVPFLRTSNTAEATELTFGRKLGETSKEMEDAAHAARIVNHEEKRNGR